MRHSFVTFPLIWSLIFSSGDIPHIFFSRGCSFTGHLANLSEIFSNLSVPSRAPLSPCLQKSMLDLEFPKSSGPSRFRVPFFQGERGLSISFPLLFGVSFGFFMRIPRDPNGPFSTPFLFFAVYYVESLLRNFFSPPCRPRYTKTIT